MRHTHKQNVFLTLFQSNDGVITLPKVTFCRGANGLASQQLPCLRGILLIIIQAVCTREGGEVVILLLFVTFVFILPSLAVTERLCQHLPGVLVALLVPV